MGNEAWRVGMRQSFLSYIYSISRKNAIVFCIGDSDAPPELSAGKTCCGIYEKKKGKTMSPKVKTPSGKVKHFPYTKAGKAAAKKAKKVS